MRAELPRLYSQDLLNNLFRHPHTRTAFVQADLGVSRVTAAKYLDQLTQHNFLAKVRAGRNNYYIHTELVNLFVETSGE